MPASPYNPTSHHIYLSLTFLTKQMSYQSVLKVIEISADYVTVTMNCFRLSVITGCTRSAK